MDSLGNEKGLDLETDAGRHLLSTATETQEPAPDAENEERAAMTTDAAQEVVVEAQTEEEPQSAFSQSSSGPSDYDVQDYGERSPTPDEADDLGGALHRVQSNVARDPRQTISDTQRDSQSLEESDENDESHLYGEYEDVQAEPHKLRLWYDWDEGVILPKRKDVWPNPHSMGKLSSKDFRHEPQMPYEGPHSPRIPSPLRPFREEILTVRFPAKSDPKEWDSEEDGCEDRDERSQEPLARSDSCSPPEAPVEDVRADSASSSPRLKKAASFEDDQKLTPKGKSWAELDDEDDEWLAGIETLQRSNKSAVESTSPVDEQRTEPFPIDNDVEARSTCPAVDETPAEVVVHLLRKDSHSTSTDNREDSLWSQELPVRIRSTTPSLQGEVSLRCLPSATPMEVDSLVGVRPAALHGRNENEIATVCLPQHSSPQNCREEPSIESEDAMDEQVSPSDVALPDSPNSLQILEAITALDHDEASSRYKEYIDRSEHHATEAEARESLKKKRSLLQWFIDSTAKNLERQGHEPAPPIQLPEDADERTELSRTLAHRYRGLWVSERTNRRLEYDCLEDAFACEKHRTTRLEAELQKCRCSALEDELEFQTAQVEDLGAKWGREQDENDDLRAMVKALQKQLTSARNAPSCGEQCKARAEQLADAEEARKHLEDRLHEHVESLAACQSAHEALLADKDARIATLEAALLAAAPKSPTPPIPSPDPTTTSFPTTRALCAPPNDAASRRNEAQPPSDRGITPSPHPLPSARPQPLPSALPSPTHQRTHASAKPHIRAAHAIARARRTAEDRAEQELFAAHLWATFGRRFTYRRRSERQAVLLERPLLVAQVA